jgi:hypothetical protein
MLRQRHSKKAEVFRTIAEYAGAIGIAVLASYLILGARW